MLANLDLEVSVALRVPVVAEELGVPQASLEPRETLAVTAHQEAPGRGDPKVLRDQSASPDRKDPTDPPERTDFPDTLDREERLVSKERPALLDQEVLWDHRDQLERLVRPEREDTPAPQAPPVSRVCPDQLERKAARVTPAPWVSRGNQDLLA